MRNYLNKNYLTNRHIHVSQIEFDILHSFKAPLNTYGGHICNKSYIKDSSETRVFRGLTSWQPKITITNLYHKHYCL